LLVLAGCLVLPLSPAFGDADPASDYLLGAPIFFPFQPPAATSLQNELQRELAQLKAKGLSLKVAVIGAPTDLGAVANLYGRPQAYAGFLGQEISFNQPQPLLVVMPNGFGVFHAGPVGALSGLKVDAAHQSNGLVRSAIFAVQRIAAANGKPIILSSVAPANSRSGGGVSPLISFGAPAVLVILGALLASRLRRKALIGAEATDTNGGASGDDRR
jgi:hypothetical protein